MDDPFKRWIAFSGLGQQYKCYKTAEWLEWEKIKFTQENLCLRVNTIIEFLELVEYLAINWLKN
jgi:hypothetical protein